MDKEQLMDGNSPTQILKKKNLVSINENGHVYRSILGQLYSKF